MGVDHGIILIGYLDNGDILKSLYMKISEKMTTDSQLKWTPDPVLDDNVCR